LADQKLTDREGWNGLPSNNAVMIGPRRRIL